MVKFGRHLQFYLESDEQSSDNDPFIVPYADVKENIGQSQAQFAHAWQASLKAASDDYSHRTRSLWEDVFGDLFNLPGMEQEYRGLPHEEAIQLYASTMSESRSTELFATIKKIHHSASMNAEALRKLVKKFDKSAVARGDDMLTATLIPELYSANLMAYTTLEPIIESLRDSLVVMEEEEEDLDEDSAMHSIRKKTIESTKDNADVRRRADELSWLHDLLARRIPVNVTRRLVAHRGFHCPRDNSGKRPLENSLSSFESAWSAGIHLCECDVALTKDEKLVLAHDEDFRRLALDPSKTSSTKKVGDLTMKEIISLTFKSGTRPPLLLDILRSAEAIGGYARLVVEIKPGNQEACTALIRLFRQHPELLQRCAAIMSFDCYTMHKLKSELNELAASLAAESTTSPERSDSPDHVGNIEGDIAQIKLPEVLLLTVAEEPKKQYELMVGVADFSPVDSWLRHEGKPSLDGVYLQYEPEMLRPRGSASLRALSRKYDVGVWGYFGDPDNYATAASLIRDCGVSFINTDLPRNFMSK